MRKDIVDVDFSDISEEKINTPNKSKKLMLTGEKEGDEFNDDDNEIPNRPVIRRPSNFLNSQRQDSDLELSIMNSNSENRGLFDLKAETKRKSKELIEEKFDEFWTIILKSEFPDEKAAENFAKTKGLISLKTIHYSRRIILSSGFVIFMTILVLYTLFLINFKFVCCSNVVDTFFDVLTILVMIFFIIEFVLNLIGDVEYFNSFYFYTDIASFILLIFDISAVREPVFSINSDSQKTAVLRIFTALSSLSVVRVIKLIRYLFQKRYRNIREYYYFKLKLDGKIAETMLIGSNYQGRPLRMNSFRRNSLRNTITTTRQKSTLNRDRNRTSKLQRNKQLTTLLKERRQSVVDDTKMNNKMYFVVNNTQLKESKLSRRMLYLTNKRLMMLLLLMLVIIPIFNVEFWRQRELAYEKDLAYLARLKSDFGALSDSYLNDVLIPNYKDFNRELISLTVPNHYEYKIDSSSLRHEELRQHSEEVNFTVNGTNSLETGVIEVSVRKYVQFQALLNIFQVIAVCLIFYFGTYYFKKEARKQILNPLEGMLEKINQVSKNPARALQLDKSHSNKYNSDIKLIENTIQKIAYLLVLGFGGAGNDLLANALKSSDFDIENISQAKKVYGIFGFCDIRRFTDATEVLLGEIMVFVNTIGKIVHEEVSKTYGGANKNIGDAFLVFWKLQNSEVSDVAELTKFSLEDDQKQRIHRKYSEYERMDSFEIEDEFALVEQEKEDSILKKFYYNNLQNSKIAELSLISFLKIIKRISLDSEVIKYNKYKKLKRAMPDFKVHLGFGLHAGWAIEGAIGSVLKIDMTYLSPHVNMSARLEGLTKAYGVPLLFTNCLYNLFTTNGIKNICRRLDRVFVPKTTEPFDLYTVNLYEEKLEKVRAKSIKALLTSHMISYKNLRMDFISNNYLRNEKAKEENLLLNQVNLEPVEDEYIEYNRIERMFERIIMDKDLVTLLNLEGTKAEKLNQELFMNNYSSALQEYLDGEWEDAKGMFEKLIYSHPEDKSTRLIYEHMKKTRFMAPRDWKYARPISD